VQQVRHCCCCCCHGVVHHTPVQQHSCPVCLLQKMHVCSAIMPCCNVTLTTASQSMQVAPALLLLLPPLSERSGQPAPGAVGRRASRPHQVQRQGAGLCCACLPASVARCAQLLMTTVNCVNVSYCACWPASVTRCAQFQGCCWSLGCPVVLLALVDAVPSCILHATWHKQHGYFAALI
jgi:hypothetical protein